MLSDFLQNILRYKQSLNKQKQAFYSTLRGKLEKEIYDRYRVFHKAVSREGQVNLIAEIKKASPSKGLLREDFDCVKIAKIYEQNHAAAVSVLTEDKFFLGRPEYVKQVSDATRLPVLTKDFIIDDGQIYEAAVNRASAILLIVRILTDSQLSGFIRAARNLDLDCLVEVHNEEEVDRALNAGADIIGINNRDLETFKVDLDTSRTLIPRIPKGKVIVAESGLSSRREIEELYDLGVNAVLIGETFMKEADIAAKMKELVG